MNSVARWQLYLPGKVVRRLDLLAKALTDPGDGTFVDFSQPLGEASLAPPDSVSWRVFKNPVSIFIGGVTAVLLELAEPRVRTGVWEHSGFRRDPVLRLRRTGLAAMVTVYGARSTAEAMIGGVRRMHSQVSGETPAGQAYRANDPELLRWVYATASFGFLQAYHNFVAPLSQTDRDRFYSEGQTAARLYGVEDLPRSEAGIEKLFQAMRPHLERSDIVFEFLETMRTAPILPAPLRPAQRIIVKAAIDNAPCWSREILGLQSSGLGNVERAFVKRAASVADRIALPSGPPARASRRVGRDPSFLYRRG